MFNILSRVAGGSHSTVMLLLWGSPSIFFMPASSDNSFFIDITQWPHDIAGIINDYYDDLEEEHTRNFVETVTCYMLCGRYKGLVKK